MSRSLKKGPNIDERLIEKIKKTSKESKESIKTWNRSCIIVPEMVGFTFGVYNGKTHLAVKVSEDMVGHKLGEFSPTRKFIKHGGRMAREEEIEQKGVKPPVAKGEKTAPENKESPKKGEK